MAQQPWLSRDDINPTVGRLTRFLRSNRPQDGHSIEKFILDFTGVKPQLVVYMVNGAYQEFDLVRSVDNDKDERDLVTWVLGFLHGRKQVNARLKLSQGAVAKAREKRLMVF